MKRDKNGNRTLSNKQRKQIKSIPARKPKSVLATIPKKPAKRRKLVTENVQKGNYKCVALNCEVEIISPTIKHMGRDAQYNRRTVVAQLNYRDILKRAKLIYADLPKKNKSQEGFEIMYILFYRMKNIGEIKLVIGRKHNGRKIVYTIDAVEIWT